jgi:hypothetical protein
MDFTFFLNQCNRKMVERNGKVRAHGVFSGRGNGFGIKNEPRENPDDVSSGRLFPL